MYHFMFEEDLKNDVEWAKTAGIRNTEFLSEWSMQN